jgi:mRNA interferase RelE/StbE
LNYKIIFHKKAEKELKKFDRDIKKRIVYAIEKLKSNPRISGAKKMTDSPYWKFRVGDYRIIYEILDKELIIIVIKIKNRKDVYRKN